MIPWLKTQVFLGGVFSIYAASKSLLAFCALLTLGRKFVLWVRDKRSAKCARLVVETRKLTGGDVELVLRNTSITATAYNVELYFDGKEFRQLPYYQYCSWWDEDYLDIPPGEFEVCLVGKKIQPSINKVFISWENGKKKERQYSSPRRIEALPSSEV